jgi:alkylated DNA repair dioxygenase AlkB
MSRAQASLFPPFVPQGMTYRAEFIDRDEERGLLENIRALPLREAQYRQYTARRRTVNYGFAYDFTHQRANAAPPIPEFLAPLRVRAAQWSGVAAEDFVQALIAEYVPGTPLGWHRDVPDFELIVGISLLGAARIRFRPYPWKPERRKEVFALELEPRSAYILRDEARWGWQHSIPPTKELRYSVTFRTARKRGTAPSGER